MLQIIKITDFITSRIQCFVQRQALFGHKTTLETLQQGI